MVGYMYKPPYTKYVRSKGYVMDNGYVHVSYRQR